MDELTSYSLSLHDGDQDYFKSLEQIYQKFQKEKHDLTLKGQTMSPDCFVQQNFNLDPLSQGTLLLNFISTISQNLQEDSYAQFIKKTMVPDKCAAAKVSLPPFKANSFQSVESAPLEDKISQVLAQHRPLEVSLCSSYYVNSSTKDCGAHATVIEGQRQVCCQGQCELQYHVLDSSGLIESPTNLYYGDGWVSSAKLLKSAQLYTKRVVTADNKILHDYYKKVDKATEESMRQSNLTDHQRQLLLALGEKAKKTARDIIGPAQSLVWIDGQ